MLCFSCEDCKKSIMLKEICCMCFVNLEKGFDYANKSVGICNEEGSNTRSFGRSVHEGVSAKVRVDSEL